MMCQRIHFRVHFVFGAIVAAALFPAVVRGDAAEDLFAAARGGEVERIKSILTASPSLIDTKDRQGDTPLFAAVERFQVDAVDALLRAGASVEGSFRRDWRMLHAAAFFGQDDGVTAERRRAVASLLIAHGASLAASDEQKVTPVHVAAMKGRIDLLALFLEAKADLNAKDARERTAMHIAASFDKPDVIRWLIEHGADPSPKDHLGSTPLHAAVYRFRQEATAVLIEAGADVNAKDDSRRTPLHLTAIAGPAEKEVDILMAGVAELLLAHGADPKAWDDANKTTIQYAKEKGRDRVAAVISRYFTK